MIFTAFRPSYVDEFGEHEEHKNEWEPPIGMHDYCYVIYKGLFGRYKIKESRVYSFWYTGIWGWKLSNGWYIESDRYEQTVFGSDDLQKAIEACEKKNRMRKVKVARMR